ncbi:hypothetical protein PHLCEN_2v13072 [Hermanssonia centrifuga]|uniref:Uncharacterized protein n=1 Tax=Hermanssonia centrifuga TaxID=98765 RepID=A0A2R6NFF4_9APHY|nr:hypothetical protein PHLCEN_2v13072 [Hermanssonia centrifuga]
MAVPTTTQANGCNAVHDVVKPNGVTSSVSLPPTPSESTHTSRSNSPAALTEVPTTSPEENSVPKKKKKKKAKKSSKTKGASDTNKPADENEERPPGPWLQLPVELLESLLVINLDPATLSATDTRPPPLLHSHSHSSGANGTVQRARGFASLADHSPPDSPHSSFANLPPPPPLPAPKPGKATPPPIDPGVFRSVTQIRRLIDEASELSVRASSGLSAAALGSMRGGSGFNQSPWSLAHSLGLGGMGENGNGRNVAMSAMRVHRLRALAVQKLAAAYKADEIASSVMVMQGGSVFDDIAERVLKVGAYLATS